MASDVAPTPCTSCGIVLARSEMFGPDEALQCPDCAQGIRQRLQVRLRLRPKEHGLVVTKTCMAICGIVYAFIWFARRGGKWPGWLDAILQDHEIWTGEAWRHLTVVFIHFDLLHVGLNMVGTIWVGRVLERYWGPRVMIALVLLTGISASAAQWMMDGGGIGFSGAWYGLCGYLWGQRRHNPIARQFIDKRMQNTLIMWLFVGVILSQTGTLPIGNWAHGGGLVSGYLIGVLADGKRRWQPWAAGLGLLVVLVVAAQQYAFGTARLRGGGKASRAELRKQYLQYVEYESQLRKAREQTPEQPPDQPR